MRGLIGLLLGGLLLVGGCDFPDTGGGHSGPPPGTLATQDFVAVVVALRQAEQTVAEADSAQDTFEELRSQVLAEYAVTEEELRDFVTAYAEKPDVLAAVWDTINERLKRPADPEEDPMGARGGPRAF
jgi:hypothetical protein